MFFCDGGKKPNARQIEVEHDTSVSLMHHMSVIPAIVVVLGKVQCTVHVDFWVHVQARVE